MRMALAESIETIRMRYKIKMDNGRMRETPGAVLAETDKLTSNIIRSISAKHTKRNARRRGFTDITAAAIVEEQLIKELREDLG